LTNGSRCDTIDNARGGKSPPPLAKKTSKKLKKGLDKRHKMCYNKYADEGKPR